MTAYESYFKAIEEGHLPAVVPIRHVDGGQGIATQVLKVEDNEKAQKFVFSDDKKTRAYAALYAIEHASNSVERHYEDIRPVVQC